MVKSLTTNWILVIVGGIIIGILYFICCIYSVKKALRDRKAIIERNQERRNNKYLKDMGLDSQNIFSDSSFGGNTQKQTANENGKTDWSLYQNCPPTKARKVNLEDIDEIINEAISAADSTNSSFVDKTVSETSHGGGVKDHRDDKKAQEPLISEKNRIISGDSGPRVYYLKARNSEPREQEALSNWVTDRLNNASSFAVAQRQLQYGFKKAPLAKQNSGFSSMDEDSSAS